MSLRVDIDVTGLAAEDLAELSTRMQDAAGLHARIAGDAEIFVKERGKVTAAGEHRTANRLGAVPTGHLVDAYEAIEGVSSAQSASLLVPGASRLRAAFGRYVVTPKNGSKFLTIPVAREAYGKRAGEFEDLFFLRAGPRKTPLLARNAGLGFQTMYVLVPKAEIPEDPNLIPFEDLGLEARDSAEAFIDEAIQAALPA
jgi:hypothetical protein